MPEEIETQRTFDRNPSLDPRNDDHPYRQAAATSGQRRWKTGPVLDQGNIGACVGFGWSGGIAALPDMGHPARVRACRPEHAVSLYMLATDLDTIKGEYPNSDTGSTVLAGAKACQALGYIDTYTWCQSSDDVLDAIRNRGPVIFGVTWYKSMFYPDANGYLVVDPSSGVAGGHCIYAPGAFSNDDIELRNSWGVTYGVGGSVRVSRKSLDMLMRDGEACVPHKWEI